MSDFPYTDDEVRAYAAALQCHREAARNDLLDLYEAGISLSIPTPRYYVKQLAGRWEVHDRKRNTWLASFGGTTAEHHAREHADRLNREVSS